MMPDSAPEQEPRNKAVSFAVTRAEKRAVTLVAAHRDMSESDLMRDLTIVEIVAEYARLFPDQHARLFPAQAADSDAA